MWLAALGAIALALVAACSAPEEATGFRPIAVTSAPASLGADEIGRLRFLGGLALDSADRDFGGISDIAVSADGAFLAITDAGMWVRGRVVLDEAGAPTGVADVAMAPMRDEAGDAFPSKEDADAEGLAFLADGRALVSFEQTQTLRLYSAPGGPAAPGPALDGVAALEGNSGLEALALTADGAILVGAEGVGGDGLLWRTALDAETAPAPFARYDLDLGFGLVELEALAGGDVIALERFYAPVIGTRIRVTLLDGPALAEGRVEKSELAFLGAGLALDNFEGVSAVAAQDGRTRLYLVSDDNFNARQRTLLYAFEIVAEETP